MFDMFLPLVIMSNMFIPTDDQAVVALSEQGMPRSQRYSPTLLAQDEVCTHQRRSGLSRQVGHVTCQASISTIIQIYYVGS